jgi:hypothetical protein
MTRIRIGRTDELAGWTRRATEYRDRRSLRPEPGRAGSSSAMGADRGSFGRGSKVLFSWVRAQINVAPYSVDDNNTLIIASGKCKQR